MSNTPYKQQYELSRLIERLCKQDGVHPTTIPSLFLIRESIITEPISRVNEPSFCIILQGEKEVLLGEERFLYGPGHYIVASVDLPVTGQVIKASADSPYLAFKLEFTSSQVLEVLNGTDFKTGQGKNAKRAMYVSEIEPSLLNAVVRLASLLGTPKHIPVLAPLLKKEILYWILQGPHGEALEQMALEGSNASRIREVIDHIINNYEESFRIEELAEIANMSVSSLHRHFKDVTAMSPIQFQKRLRLQEARRLLLAESLDVADVAFRVGYESQSQFSREYSRMFGFPPRVDIKRMREHYV
ncbi:AraC-like DNA-binding protein [Bacillus aryabhattai]|jgi:AraC-like DNA-binding protein|uniref:Transcriptional Regulator N/C terminus, AraC family n=2 Tax=Priestia TaxID=2800373 RepID=D5E4E0_PRIM1|nr:MULTISPECIES: AraC family transcriptional regulator [Priestia]KOP69588.1 AraC family transcriptional regulator [Bacillus sp. FJAT-21351]KQU13692.1 AraC family transcriptional regulator [Bacillus sp. Leaf75]MCJ7983081.1 AraC family transcriptional regulator [Priestia sp. OVL9]ADE72665.1 transcriptional Regulator N/C terminus, AraC family [Priestia megaterium QM B1551]MBA9042128.1 AraC-like DNA-binding protein [Priestia aryabhattai]